MGNRNSKKAAPEPTDPPLPMEVNPVVDQKDYGKPYRSLSFLPTLINTFFAAMPTAKWLSDAGLAQTYSAFSYLWLFWLLGLALGCLQCPRETYQGLCFYNAYIECSCSNYTNFGLNYYLINYSMQGSSPDRQLGAGVWEGWNVGQVNLDLQIKDWNRWSSGSCFSSLTWRNAWILQSLLKVA